MADQPISQEIRLPTNSDEVGKAAKKLDELIARVDKLDHATERHHKKSEEGWKGVGKTIEETKRKTGEFFEFIGAALAFEMLSKLAEKFADIGKEALGAAAKAERMNFAINHAAGGKEQGEQVRKWVEANAKFSEFSEQVNESSYLSMKRFGVGDQKAGLYMKAAEDLAAMAGPDERMGVYQEALSAFQRMHARGKLDTRSAMRLGLGVEDFAALPQFQGMNKKSISKAIQSGAGNVTENDILNMIVKHTGEKGIGERGAEASQLLLTRWQKITELPDRFYKRLGETSAVKRLSDELGGVLEKLDPDSPTGKRIFGALESTFTLLADKVGEMDFEEMGNVISDDVLPVMKAMIGLIGPVVDGLERFFRGAERVHKMFSGTPEEKARARSEAAASVTSAVDSAGGGHFSKNIDFVKKLVNANSLSELPSIGDLFGRGEPAGQAHGGGYAKGIEGAAPSTEAAATGIGERSHEALMSSIDAHSPSRKTEEAGGHFGEGFALGIERSAGRIDDAIDSTIRMPSGGATSVAGGRGMSISFGDINITVTGGQSNAETAGALMDELKKGIKPMFIDLMDEIDLEGSA